MVYLIPLSVGIVIISAAGILYFTLPRVPLDYGVPVEVKKGRVDYRSLTRDFASYFPREEERKQKPAAVAQNVKLPKPLQILGYSRGGLDAVILRAGKETLILVEGETNRGWKLLKVDEKFAYLTYGGKEVKLPLPEEKEETKTARVGLKREKPAAEEFRLSRRLVNRMMADYGRLLSQIDVVPYIENGKTIGFKIRWIMDGSIFEQLGFKKGDVILAVNGVPIRSTEDVFKAVQIIRNEPSIRVKILRDGEERYLNIRID